MEFVKVKDVVGELHALCQKTLGELVTVCIDPGCQMHGGYPSDSQIDKVLILRLLASYPSGDLFDKWLVRHDLLTALNAVMQDTPRVVALGLHLDSARHPPSPDDAVIRLSLSRSLFLMNKDQQVWVWRQERSKPIPITLDELKVAFGMKQPKDREVAKFFWAVDDPEEKFRRGLSGEWVFDGCPAVLENVQVTSKHAEVLVGCFSKSECEEPSTELVIEVHYVKRAYEFTMWRHNGKRYIFGELALCFQQNTFMNSCLFFVLATLCGHQLDDLDLSERESLAAALWHIVSESVRASAKDVLNVQGGVGFQDSCVEISDKLGLFNAGIQHERRALLQRNETLPWLVNLVGDFTSDHAAFLKTIGVIPIQF